MLPCTPAKPRCRCFMHPSIVPIALIHVGQPTVDGRRCSRTPLTHMQRSRMKPGRRTQASTSPSGPIDRPRADDADDAIVSCKAAKIGAGGHSAVASTVSWGQDYKGRYSAEARHRAARSQNVASEAPPHPPDSRASGNVAEVSTIVDNASACTMTGDSAKTPHDCTG